MKLPDQTSDLGFTDPRSSLRGRPGSWSIDVDACHVWWARLLPNERELSKCWQWLSDSERVRARKFRFQPDLDKYVLRRGLLRKLLGFYLDCSPVEIGLCTGACGKPRLTQSHTGLDLRFNVSHSGELAVY